MSKLLSSHHDKEAAIDQLFTLIRTLTFHGLDQAKQRDLAQHLLALRNDVRDLDIQCTVAYDPRTEVTAVSLSLAHRKLVLQS